MSAELKEPLNTSESKSILVSSVNSYEDETNSSGLRDGKFAETNKMPSSLIASKASFQCPEQFGYFADSTDCSRYFVCVFGDPLHETCTGGLYFSSELLTCDWPQHVSCQSELSPSLEAPESEKRKSLSSDTLPNADSALNRERDESSSVTESSVDEYGSNDLDQPTFDESIASFIDQNGDVYVHDGPGGLYSLIERTSAISDHDKPILYDSSALGTAKVNAIEKVCYSSDNCYP